MHKLISDIRVYESKELIDVLDSGYRKPTTKVYPSIAAQAKFLPRRFALQLRFSGFTVESGDHFFLYLVPSLEHGAVLADSAELYCRGYKCGVDPARFCQMDPVARETFFIDAIYTMMKIAADAEGLDADLLKNVRGQIIEFGEDLQIVLAEKSNSFCECRVSFTWREYSKLFCSVRVNSTGSKTSFEIMDLLANEDAFELVGRISIRKDYLCIYPRKNEVARCTLLRYAPVLTEQKFLSNNSSFIQIPMDQEAWKLV